MVVNDFQYPSIMIANIVIPENLLLSFNFEKFSSINSPMNLPLRSALLQKGGKRVVISHAAKGW